MLYLAANSQISVLIDQNMQLTGCDYGNDMRNAICVERSDMSGAAVHSLYCDLIEGLGVARAHMSCISFDLIEAYLGLKWPDRLKTGQPKDTWQLKEI